MEMFHNKILRLGFFLVLLIVGVLQMSFRVQEQQVFGGHINGLAVDRVHDARLLTRLAKKKYLFDADIQGAKVLLKQALISASYSIPAWLSLAELYNDEGHRQQSRQVLEYTDLLTSEINRWRWEKTLVDYQVGRTEILASELSYIIAEVPGKTRRDGLQLAFTLWDSPDDLLLNVGYKNIKHLMAHAIAKKLPKKGLFFWQIMQNRGVTLEERTLLSFLDMLLREGEIRAAGDIWRAYFNSQSILFNQDFAKPFCQLAFGWRAWGNKAFTMKFEPSIKDGSGRSLHYRFKGWQNFTFEHLYQIVPLVGGQLYEFTGEFKTKNVTTDQRPFVEIYGFECNKGYAKSAQVEANKDWTTIKFIFGVSEECESIVVRLRRDESWRIDNKLAGQLWLRNFEIIQTGQIFTVFDALPL
ncbi:MAG: hypothetical protein COA36_07830 [Desulfotalea sp.]|nr:MAG: hypothetical protein COA36_07830 [Desulfotalea sp.]